MSEPRILYHCPCWDDVPTGGVLCIYRHVEALHRRGFRAWVLHQRTGVRASWFPHDAPILYQEQGEGPGPGDVLVVPEGFRSLMTESAGQPYTVDVFAQSFSFHLQPGESWRGLGIRGVMVVSRPLQRFVRRTLGHASTLIRPSVDRARFRPGPKRLQIACMPRKHPGDLRRIEVIFRLLHPEYRSVPFVPIDGEPHSRVAEILAESAVFLATGYPEGFGLPPLEAMACGCLVVGFSGGGGREYMRHGESCWVAADGDVLAAARHLGTAVRAFARGEDAGLRARAQRTAEDFSPQAEEEALARHWGRRLEEEARRSRARRPPSGGNGTRKRLAVLSVHYRYPELLADQIARLRPCAGPLARELDLALRFHPILHRSSQEEVVRAAAEATHGRGEFRVRSLDLRSLAAIPRGAEAHGHSLAAAFRLLRSEEALGDGDLVAILDHDAHPVHVRMLADLAAALHGPAAPAGVGIPQWQRGHCYLHPSLLLTRVETIDRIGPETAFQVRIPPDPHDDDWSDTSEEFTVWCEAQRLPVLPLRVTSTAFPWSRWDSDMVPGRGTELTGWHGEAVRVGHLMGYGLLPGLPLVSHLWAGPADPAQRRGFSHHTWDEVLAAYLAEPLEDRVS